jgi:hypothetical protein
MKKILNSSLVLIAFLALSNVSYAGKVLVDGNTFWIKCNNGWISPNSYSTQAAAQEAIADVCVNSGGITVQGGIKPVTGKKK